MAGLKWIALDAVLAAHAEQLAEHGGSDGIRDMGLLESALARPLNLAAYGEPDIASLAASYASGIAWNHPFVDGNKRTAWVVAIGFLYLNGFRLEAGMIEAYDAMLGLAAKERGEDEFAAWLRQHLRASA
jgi:death-on-curing protein